MHTLPDFLSDGESLGKEDVAAEYEELYHKIVKKFQETFFDAEGNMTAQTQTAHYCGTVFPAELLRNIITKTVEGLKRFWTKKTVIWLPDLWELRISAMH